MIVYVAMEHEGLASEPQIWHESLARTLVHKYRFEDIAGEECLVVRYHQANRALVSRLAPSAVVVSGHRTVIDRYDPARLAGLWDLLRLPPAPTLCICGGLQAMARAWDGRIAPMGERAPGTAPSPDFFADHLRQECGFLPVNADDGAVRHPLFAGLGARPVVFQAHYWEVKAMPPEFVLLASTEACPVQAVAHRTLPLLGVQFHPEYYNDEHADGRRILANFFDLARAGRDLAPPRAPGSVAMRTRRAP